MNLARIRSHRASDWIGFIVFGYFAVDALSKMPAAGVFLLPAIIFEAFVAISFLIRDRPRAAVRTFRARFSAYCGTALLVLFLQMADRFFPHWVKPNEVLPLIAVGALIWFASSLWSIYAVWYLRHSFSIEAEARRLVTSGPYQFARHPVYTGYLGQYLGMWLVYPSVPFALALVVWALLMADRIGHEERILTHTFPEYEGYKQRVGALATFSVRRPMRVLTES